MNPWRVLDQLRRVYAREYLRVSQDRFKGRDSSRRGGRSRGGAGKTRSTGQQHDDHVGDAREFGWCLGKEYEDAAVSASRHGRKRRDDFEQLICDLENDLFGAQVLIIWENSRGSRKVEEWLKLINLCVLRSVFIWVSSEGRLYDPADPGDRKDLLHDAVDSEAESGRISKRTRRNAAACARAGRPHGPVAYGYRRVYDSATGELVTQEPVPEEAVHVAELFYKFIAGYSLYQIARVWEERGIRSRGGTVFCDRSLRPMLMSPTYAGLRGHAVGATGGNTQYTEEQLYPGCWDEIVPEEVWLS